MTLEKDDSGELLLMTKNDLFDFDLNFLQNNTCLIGTDEAGRGPGAGPVVAAAVCFNKTDNSLIDSLCEINDSKKLSELKREKLFEIIVKNTVCQVVFGTVEEIEKNNILQTSLNCMKKACLSVIEQLCSQNVYVIVDGNKLIPNFIYKQQSIIKGDSKSASIAAASILAKVSRDRFMNKLDKDFPQYNWAKNKGYLTSEHLDAIDKYGINKYHRKKFLEKHFSKQLKLFNI